MAQQSSTAVSTATTTTSTSSSPQQKQQLQQQQQYRFPWSQLIGGATAGAVSVVVVSPLEVARTRLQAQRVTLGQTVAPYYNGTYGTIRTIIKEEGIRGCYRGMGVNIMALAPNWMLFFTSYSELKKIASRMGVKDGPVLHVNASIAAGAITALGVTPFWVIKTRLQTQHALIQIKRHASAAITASGGTPSAPRERVLYTGSWHALKTIVQTEGAAALWSGLVPQLLGSVHVAIQFPLYEKFKAELGIRAQERNNGKARHLNALELVTASAASKVIATAAAYPHEVIRVRLQAQRADDRQRYTGVRHAVRTIWTTEGIRGFYSGLTTTLIRAVPSCAVTFTLYEIIQRNVVRYTAA